MADNTAQNGTDTIATDEVATLNGGASSGVKVQRVKNGFGDDGDYRDVSRAFPMPTVSVDGTLTGTITATDAVLGNHLGLGVPLTGTPTAGSYVAFPVNGQSGFSLRLSGTFGGGTVWMESSVDSTNGVDGAWTTNLVRQSGVDTTHIDTTLTAPGIWRGTAAGYSYLRVRVVGATAPSIGVVFRAAAVPSVTAQVAALPPGGNSIGALYPTPAYTIGTATGTTPATTGQIGRMVRATSTAAFAAATTLIAAPAAGTRIYVTGIVASNAGATLTVVRLFAGALPAAAAAALAVTNDVVDVVLAANSGGGAAVMTFPPHAPWALPAATALSFAVTAATTWTISVTYYVAT